MTLQSLIKCDKTGCEATVRTTMIGSGWIVIRFLAKDHLDRPDKGKDSHYCTRLHAGEELMARYR
jgi:hypothetical protein